MREGSVGVVSCSSSCQSPRPSEFESAPEISYLRL